MYTRDAALVVREFSDVKQVLQHEVVLAGSRGENLMFNLSTRKVWAVIHFSNTWCVGAIASPGDRKDGLLHACTKTDIDITSKLLFPRQSPTA